MNESVEFECVRKRKTSPLCVYMCLCVSMCRTAAGLHRRRVFPFINKIDAKYDFSFRFRFERVTNSSTHKIYGIFLRHILSAPRSCANLFTFFKFLHIIREKKSGVNSNSIQLLKSVLACA